MYAAIELALAAASELEYTGMIASD